MYLQRKIDQYLAEWKSNEYRKPLIVKGARQIGKTESIRSFAEKNYKSFIEINFVEEPKYKAIISDGYQAADIISNEHEYNERHIKILKKLYLYFLKTKIILIIY